MRRYHRANLLKQPLETASVEAIRVAAEWLAEAMRQLVSVGQHSMVKSHKAHQASRPGQPPFTQSGRGRESIRMVPTPEGAQVGAFMDGFNYMAAWNSEEGIRGKRRPWLSRFFTMPERYQAPMKSIIVEIMKIKTGLK